MGGSGQRAGLWRKVFGAATAPGNADGAADAGNDWQYAWLLPGDAIPAAPRTVVPRGET